MKWLGNIGLTVLSAVLFFYLIKWLLIGSIIICVIQSIRKLKKEPLADYFYEGACLIDEGGNVFGGPVWNLIMFWPWAKPRLYFGSRKQTMSMVYGCNLDGLTFMEAVRLYTPIALTIIVIVECLDWGHMQRAAHNFKNTFPNGTID